MERNVACRAKYMYHLLTCCEGSAGGSRVQWLFACCLGVWSWVEFLGKLVSLQEGPARGKDHSGRAVLVLGVCVVWEHRQQADGCALHEPSEEQFMAIQVGW